MEEEEVEGEYYRKLAVPFIAAINVVTRCGPAMNRLPEAEGAPASDLMNVRNHLAFLSFNPPLPIFPVRLLKVCLP